MRWHPGVGIFVGAMALSLANCSSTYRDFCQSTIDCEGGNDKDVDACVDQLKGVEDVSDEYDCGDQWSDTFDCTEKATCQDGNFKVSDPSCSQKLTAWSTCVKAASGKKDPDIDL